MDTKLENKLIKEHSYEQPSHDFIFHTVNHLIRWLVFFSIKVIHVNN